MNETLRDFGSFMLGMLGLVVVVGGPLIALGMWGDHSACARVCEENGHENGWDWWMGCFCKDDEGLYNPKDSRDVAPETK